MIAFSHPFLIYWIHAQILFKKTPSFKFDQQNFSDEIPTASVFGNQTGIYWKFSCNSAVHCERYANLKRMQMQSKRFRSTDSPAFIRSAQWCAYRALLIVTCFDCGHCSSLNSVQYRTWYLRMSALYTLSSHKVCCNCLSVDWYVPRKKYKLSMYKSVILG